MNRLYYSTFACLLAGLLLMPSAGVMAQDRAEKESRTVIEIKDGKVYMNGQEVAELDDADTPVFFKRDSDGESEDIWISGENLFSDEEGFVIRRGRLGDAFRVRSSPRAFGYVSGDGAKAEFFDSEQFKDAMEAQQRVQRRHAEMMADNLAEKAIRLESMAPGFAFYSSSGSLSKEAREAEQRSREIARMLRNEEGDQDALAAELDEVLGIVFDAKQAAQQERVDDMRQKLTDLEERIEQRRSDRSDIIEKRKNQLLGRSSRYDW